MTPDKANPSRVYARRDPGVDPPRMPGRYCRWIEMGALDDILTAVAREADLEWLMIDATIVRAHQHVAGAREHKGGRMPKAWAGLAAA